MVAVLLKPEALLFPKGCAGAPGAEPNGTGAAVEEPNETGAGAPNCAGAACVEPNVVDACAGVVEPKGMEFEGADVDPKPELGAGAGVEPNGMEAAGAGAVEPKVGAGTGVEPKEKGAADAGAGVEPNEIGAAAGVEPKETGAAGAGAGVEPNEIGAAGAGANVEPKVGAGVGARPPEAARELFEVLPKEEGAVVEPNPGAPFDELSCALEFVDGFPNTKGAVAGADAEAGAPPENDGTAGGLLAGFDPNDMVGWLDVVFESSLLRRFFFELPSLPSVVTLLDPVDSVFPPNEILEL